MPRRVNCGQPREICDPAGGVTGPLEQSEDIRLVGGWRREVEVRWQVTWWTNTVTLGKIPSAEHVTWFLETGKHCAPGYYCTDSNGTGHRNLREGQRDEKTVMRRPRNAGIYVTEREREKKSAMTG